MWPDRVSNPGPLTYESGALPTALRGPAVQWITMCHKNRMSTRVITVWRAETTSVSTMRFRYFEGDKNPISKGHMIIRILHSWSFYMTFMKLAKGSFHKFHMK